ncbi:MAG: type I DNA topoisomerase, partial [Clostridia bacterium]|nr:type I DNA topoisomerase [Clostridia bacterium]
MNTLVIVESPSKANTIKSFLGKGYKVKASKGHVRDLPKSKLGIDIENDFEPQYINIRGKGDLINELRKEAKAADRVLLAADPDREGEAISWHLAAVLKLDPEKTKRITFNEITKSVVKEAIKSPRDIDMNMVNSQQARRILDRLVGYQISPFLWKKIKNGLSAGRVQSVATRIIVEREEEIRAFVPEEYWHINAQLQNEQGETFSARYFGDEDGKRDLHSESDVRDVFVSMADTFRVVSVKKAVKHRKPQPPFVTSTLQQEANRRLGFQSSRTMMIAQELYEGVNIGEKSTHGLITYMRTDSLRISEEARASAKDVILSRYGEAYYPAVPNIYKMRKNAQDAHE